MKKLAVLLSLLALATVGFAACGDDEETTPEATTEATTGEPPEDEAAGGSGGGGGGGGTFAISADPDGQLAYDKDSATVPAGEVTIEFDNPASLGHDVVIEDEQGEELARTEVISESTATATAELEPGEYTFYCSVDAHRPAGMEGTLTAE